jgi:hypothetical protein
MQHPSETPVVERPALPIVSAPMAIRQEAPLLAIMFHLLGGSDRWRALPILHLRTRRSPSGVSRAFRAVPARPSRGSCNERAETALMSPERAVCAGLSRGDTPWRMRRVKDHHGGSGLSPCASRVALLWDATLGSPRQHIVYLSAHGSRPYPAARTPDRDYDIMLADRQSLSAGEMARTVAQSPYQGTCA